MIPHRLSKSLLLLSLILVMLLAACRPSPTSAAVLPVGVDGSQPSPDDGPAPVITGIGVLGDSNSDEYRADDARGEEFSARTLNWVEQLVRSRKLNFGKWGTWESPRRTGYEYNWARTGATIGTMISSGQHTGLAEQVRQGKVSVVLIWVGGNDFHLKNGPYEEIYSGKMSGAALESRLDEMAADIATAIDTILDAGDVMMGVVGVTDQGLGREAQALYPDAAKRRRVSDAVDRLNEKIQALAEERDVLYIDSNAITLDLFSRIDSQGYLVVGGAKINTMEKGNDPTHLQLGDNIGHSGTVLSGMIANEIFIKPFNRAYGLRIQPLSDAEILRTAGIKQ